jgi:hypothetical protein
MNTNMHMLCYVVCCDSVEIITAHLVYGCSHEPLHQQVANQPRIIINKRPAAVTAAE